MWAITNVSVLTPAATLYDRVVLVDGGRIEAVQTEGESPLPPGVTLIDGRGGLLVPGFIDLQLNGARGVDFTVSPDGIWPAAAWLPSTGVTAFLPTQLSPTPGQIEAALDVWLAGPPPAAAGASPLGLHLEGPYLNPANRGAHPANRLRRIRPDDTLHWSPDLGVRMVTVAPELPGAMGFIALLAGRGILVAAGHSSAGYETARRSFEAGVRYATHLFNAMPPLHHRRPGLAGAALADERVTVGLVADGRHLHPAVVKLVWQVARDGRLNLVSDATAALGHTSGEAVLGGTELAEDDDGPRLAGGALAGGALALDGALRHLIQITGCSLNQALATITATPARLLGLGHRKGQIRPGYDADLVLLDPALNVRLTMVAGQVVFETEL
jgi:N-acetylglucosamine-6-phosphate deacetylase